MALISSDPTPICVGGTIDPITTTYIGGTGTPSYQWYDNSSGFLQPLIGETSSSFDPGVMDTDMQSFIRGQKIEVMPDLNKFIYFKEDRLLKSPKEVAIEIVSKIKELII